jgi:tRNA (adenine37-N6)-methyltransferase
MNKRHIVDLTPIGIIHSPYRGSGQVPRRDNDLSAVSTIEVFVEYATGLQDIEGFSHILVMYWFHRSEGYELLVKPPGEDSVHGLFATRSPRRPCPLGLTVVELLARDENRLEVKGLDAMDGSPVLDIKPYLPEEYDLDSVRIGWLEGRRRRRSK